MSDQNMDDIILTFDIDWAPDFVIDFVAKYLVERHVRATWFVTHASPAIERLRQHPDLFELGIHPNFLPGSTHGDHPLSVLSHLLTIVPEAISIRSHAVVQSGPLIKLIVTQTQLQVDSTQFLPYMSHIQPVAYQQFGRTLLRVPFFWADDYEMGKLKTHWSLTPFLQIKGLKVFDFHPIHIYLNSPDDRLYQRLKQNVSSLAQTTETEIAAYMQGGQGTRTFFMELIEYLAATKQSLCMQDIYERWQKGTRIERADDEI